MRSSWIRWFLIPFSLAALMATLVMLVASAAFDFEVFGAALIVEALVAPSAMLYLLVRKFRMHECAPDLVYMGSLLPLTVMCICIYSTAGEGSDIGLWFLAFYLLAAVTAYVAMRWSLRSRFAD